MKLLMTAFEPFGGETVNPSALVLEKLTAPDGMQIEKRVLPVTFSGAPALLGRLIDEVQPDAVLCLGQAGGRNAITPELVAINWMDASIHDNAGDKPMQQKIAPDAPDAYFSTLPVYKMAQAATDAGISARVSLSAGAYVCNRVLFEALSIAKNRPNLRAAFVHVPFLPEQAKEKQAPSMALEEMVRGINAMLKAL